LPDDRSKAANVTLFLNQNRDYSKSPKHWSATCECLCDQQFLTKSIKLESGFTQSGGYAGSLQTKSKLATEFLVEHPNTTFHRSPLRTDTVGVNPACDFHALIAHFNP
jgi:hypothetical protein